GMDADVVFGQPNFSSSAINNPSLGAASLFSPQGIAVDSGRNVYIADTSNHRVLEYDQPVTNPTPTLASLSPSSALFGGGGFTLTVDGGVFLSGAQVSWNGGVRTTTFVSSTRLTAQILAADIAAP